MAPEPQQNERLSQMPTELAGLPTHVRVMIAMFLLGFKASLLALRDTVISKVCALTLSRIGLFGYYIPASLVFIFVHLYLFFFRQSSWRTAAITLRQFASRDGADNDLIEKLSVDALDSVSYVFMSLLFRNISVVWSVCLWSLSLLFTVFETIGLACLLWLMMIDNPIQTFKVEVAGLWNITWPIIVTYLGKLWDFITAVSRRFVWFLWRIGASMTAYRDTKTATHAATLETYRYSVLEPGEIRLLKLSKLIPWNPICCELIAIQLDKVPQFETISYTWGTQLAVKPFILNGGRFTVSERVYDILHDRASCLMTRYIWIDSICINQNDEDEKSSQVQLMKNIYGSSYQTVIWLGYAPDANDAIGFLAHLRRRVESDDPVERASRPLTQLNIEHPYWPALNRLIKHDYWTRSWVIQEIAVSKNVIISYGGELITWDYFSSLIRLLFDTDPNSVWHISKIYWRSPPPPPIDAGIQIASLGRIREVISAKQSIGLFELLIASINSSATDPRDNIYAVQGISTAANSGDIVPDYSSAIERPFLETTRYLLRQDHPSRILHLAGIGFYRSAKIRTSWAPDWSTKRVARMYWRDPSQSPYRASGTVNQEPDMIISPDNLTLAVNGVMVDYIRELGPQFFAASENGVPKTVVYPAVYNDYTNSHNMVINGTLSEPYVTGISLTEALWRTLIGDRTPADARPADRFFSEYYQALVRYIEVTRKFLGPDMQPRNINISAEEEAILKITLTKDVTDMGRFMNVSGPHLRERMIAVTERGYIGIIPPYSKVGDAVFIINGTQVPFLLRRQADTEDVDESGGRRWQLVGESYFHGMMDGEMMAEKHAEQTIELC
ncbi:putative heterokaryon incompatibility protein [Xylaria sp. FL1777]|nr:putative heterokaryon incompatibility protein [Xylaria sp. FL1777]